MALGNVKINGIDFPDATFEITEQFFPRSLRTAAELMYKCLGTEDDLYGKGILRLPTYDFDKAHIRNNRRFELRCTEMPPMRCSVFKIVDKGSDVTFLHITEVHVEFSCNYGEWEGKDCDCESCCGNEI